jgi:outer membrane protein assembly factor BamB
MLVCGLGRDFLDVQWEWNTMIRYCLATLIVLAWSGAAWAENWPNWRGPQQTGVSHAQRTPVRWSATENVLWKAELPGMGGSTPAVWGSQIFLTSGDQGENAVLSFDRDGKALWRTHVGQESPGKHKKGTGSNPSPVTDGDHVYVYFKSADLACLDLEGRVVWHHNLRDMYGDASYDDDALWWDLGSSPVLAGDLLVVASMTSGPSFLVAFDKKSGEVAWKQERNLDAPRESNQSYTTPVVVDGELLVVLGADHVTGHEVRTGREVWRVGGLNPGAHEYFRSIASPVVSDGIIVAPYARGESLTAIRLGGRGDVTASHVVWTGDTISSDVPTPAALDGRVYVVRDRGELACLDIQTGEVRWRGMLERTGSYAYSASPILADGKIYVTREDGLTTVLAQGDQFQVLATNPLDGFVVATPVPLDGRLLLRTDTGLYCVGQAE